MEISNDSFKSGYVALVGQPNVGKSTLLNALLQYHLSIISPKPQTTRQRVLGILTEPDCQMVFLDTPGLLAPAYRLQEVMMKHAWAATKNADVILYLCQSSAWPDPKDLEFLAQIKATGNPVVLAINKIDLVKKNDLLLLIDTFVRQTGFEDIVPISALHNQNIDDLKQVLQNKLPFGPPYYDSETITEHPERFFVAELIREQIFLRYGEEIPYSTAVVIEEFREQPDKKDFIKARIIVERESQKAIIIGKGGLALRRVGQEARQSIERLLERPVFLELWVVVREKWRLKDVFIKSFGYDQ